MLLRKDVDLLRDARILEVKDVDDVIVLALQDKSPDDPGRIKLFLAKKPALELREWITTDSQGLDTRVELTELNKAEDLDPGLFKPPRCPRKAPPVAAELAVLDAHAHWLCLFGI